MTERPAETVPGHVQSPITDLIQHFEVAMWARGVDPQTALEVCNIMLFGDHQGSGHKNRTDPMPDWAETMADRAFRQILADTTMRAEVVRSEEQPSEDDIRLVTLALVRLALQGAPDIYSQVLS